MVKYTTRRATLADVDTLVQQRIRMFQDMGVMGVPDGNEQRLATAYHAWLTDLMPAGTYLAWVVEARDEAARGEIVSGGGVTVIPWPPGPRYQGTRLAFVYNVYTNPEHRGRGLATRIMETIHEFCRHEGIGSVALNASTFGQPLYESMGYGVTQSPMMFLSLG
jgi:GNAT superfamily N-acetyltransferase